VIFVKPMAIVTDIFADILIKYQHFV